MTRELRRAKRSFKKITGHEPTADQLAFFTGTGREPVDGQLVTFGSRRTGRTTAALASVIDAVRNGEDSILIVRDGAVGWTMHELSHKLERVKGTRTAVGTRIFTEPPKFVGNRVRVRTRRNGTAEIRVYSMHEWSRVRPQVPHNMTVILDHS